MRHESTLQTDWLVVKFMSPLKYPMLCQVTHYDSRGGYRILEGGSRTIILHKVCASAKCITMPLINMSGWLIAAGAILIQLLCSKVNIMSQLAL